jgi:OOP family OmpA-OmpF porin
MTMRSVPTSAGALALALLLTACAAKPPRALTTVTLLPQADGTPSAVVVTARDSLQGTAPRLLDAPYQSAQVARGQAIDVRAGAAEQVQSAYAPLFAAAPLPPARFVLYFRTGGTQLTPESQQALARVMAETQRYSGAEIVLIGHTDTTSTQEANDALSLRRAALVRDMFVQRGFPPSRVEATGRGERELAVPTRDGVEESRNRRVEILVR